MCHFDSLITKKTKTETREASPNRSFYVDGVPLLWPTYIAEKARTGPKPVSCYLEHPWGTHWEPEEHNREPNQNIWTDHWEHMGTG